MSNVFFTLYSLFKEETMKMKKMTEASAWVYLLLAKALD